MSERGLGHPGLVARANDWHGASGSNIQTSPALSAPSPITSSSRSLITHPKWQALIEEFVMKLCGTKGSSINLARRELFSHQRCVIVRLPHTKVWDLEFIRIWNVYFIWTELSSPPHAAGLFPHWSVAHQPSVQSRHSFSCLLQVEMGFREWHLGVIVARCSTWGQSDHHAYKCACQEECKNCRCKETELRGTHLCEYKGPIVPIGTLVQSIL